MSTTPLTDELERSIPENAELCENWHKMQQHAHRMEEQLREVWEVLHGGKLEPGNPTAAMAHARVCDFRDIKSRFCAHHATPGAVEPGCPVCKVDFLRMQLTNEKGCNEAIMRENRSASEDIQSLRKRVEELKALLGEARIFLTLAANHCPDNAVDFKYGDGEQGIKTQGLRTTISKLVEKIKSQ